MCPDSGPRFAGVTIIEVLKLEFIFYVRRSKRFFKVGRNQSEAVA